MFPMLLHSDNEAIQKRASGCEASVTTGPVLVYFCLAAARHDFLSFHHPLALRHSLLCSILCAHLPARQRSIERLLSDLSVDESKSLCIREGISLPVLCSLASSDQ